MKNTLIATLFFGILHNCVSARDWTEFMDDKPREDPSKALLCQEFDAMKITAYPSMEPSAGPTISDPPTLSRRPSNNPSDVHSDGPTLMPSIFISSNPTDYHSSAPSKSPFPSSFPTLHPTFYPTFVRPNSSFSYNPYARHGPPNWSEVNIDENEMKEFSTLNVHSNRCDKVASRIQSPINLIPNHYCKEHHQIRTRRGDFSFSDIDFRIMPNALRMEFPRKLKVIENATEVVKYPPAADASDGWPRIPLKHVEIKIPSEHQIYGKQYPAELTIVHVAEKRVLSIAMMLDDSENKKNNKLQVFMNEWEEEYEKREYECNNSTGRKLASPFVKYQRKRPRQTAAQLEEIFGDNADSSSRSLNGDADFPFYSFLPTIWFFAYRGSLTVPPCTTNHWRVLEKPLHVSERQLKRIQEMILNQVDSNCNRSTVAYNGGVNRPIQHNVLDVPLWHCTVSDYGPDHPYKWPHLEPVHFEEQNYWKNVSSSPSSQPSK